MRKPHPHLLQALLPILCFVLLLPAPSVPARPRDTLHVRDVLVPVLLEGIDNEVLDLRITPSEESSPGVLTSLTLSFGEGSATSHIKAVKLYYGGTEARTYYDGTQFRPVRYISSLRANSSYSILKSEILSPRSDKVTFHLQDRLFPGANFYWVSVQMDGEKASLQDKLYVRVTSATMQDGEATIQNAYEEPPVHRMGVGVRHEGDDGVAAYRIPGLVTSLDGTLVAVYDIRHNSSKDLQEHIDIGVSRSTDGGRTWDPMITAIALGQAGGLPPSQNGAGDPAILVDENTGDLLIACIWAHGMGNRASWWSTVPGMDPAYTAQLVLSRSKDDGRTWSNPVSISPQVKDPSWAFFFNGPGRGITTSDGTLVFASQYTEYDAGRTPHAGIIYSRDHGLTWERHMAAKDSTTEAQVAELSDGTLMLNMRDNRGGARSVSTTGDLGRSWTEHPTSRRALVESICMGSLLGVRAEQNNLGKHLLLFSNPAVTKGRNHITLKASLDDGMSWKEANQVMLDEGEGWGYSCLSMVDKDHVGILYESSVCHLCFQVIPLDELVRER